MKGIIFDAGPIISLTTNNLLGLLTNLKEKYKGHFYLTSAIKKELIEIPLMTKKFKFEALQVLRSLNTGVLEIFDSPKLKEKTFYLLDLANKSFEAKGNFIPILHFAEVSGIAAAVLSDAEAFVVDERTTKLLIENPEKLKNILSAKLNTAIDVNKEKLDEFLALTKKIKIIRSVELAAMAYEFGFLDKFLVDIPNPNQTLLEAILWGIKLNGCTVSSEEIEDIIKFEINIQKQEN